MTSVLATAVVSVDGFVADLEDRVGPLFDFYDNGPVEATLGDTERVFHVSQASADYLAGVRERVAVQVVGRQLFDLTDGWGGRPPTGAHVVVVTHRGAPAEWRERFPDAPYEFVDGVRAAVARARELAGEHDIVVAGGQIAGQALALGLVDEIHLNVAPVVMGTGKAFFAGYDGPPLELDEPEVVVGDRVRHQVYRVRPRRESA